MDDSSSSGSDGEETAEDRQNYRDSLNKAESMAQRRRHHRNYEMVQVSASHIPDEYQIEENYETDQAIDLMGRENSKF